MNIKITIDLLSFGVGVGLSWKMEKNKKKQYFFYLDCVFIHFIFWKEVR